MPRFFIAHSSKNKAIALDLKLALHGDAWIDLHELDVGDILLEEIAAGIEQASDFVLLWSKDSATANWVEFEFHMAFIRYVEDRAINIRVVRLDETPVPLYIRPFLQLRDVAEPVDIAIALLGAPPRAPVRRSFFDRNVEIKEMESAMLSPKLGVVWFWGIPGIGKRSLVEEGLRRLVPNSNMIRKIDVDPGTGPSELLLKISGVLGKKLPDPITKEISPQELAALEEFVASRGVFVFREAQHWLEDDARPSRLLTLVLNALHRAKADSRGSLAIFTSTRRPDLDGWARVASRVVHVRGLDEDSSVALLESHGADPSDTDLLVAARQLTGHPLALEIAAADLRGGQTDWTETRISVATELIAATPLSSDAEAILEVLAIVDGPLPGHEIAQHLVLPSDRYRSTINEAVSYSLLDSSPDGSLRVHPLVRDFYRRQFSTREDRDSRLGDLATRARRSLEGLDKRSSTFVNALLSTFRLLSLAGRTNEALQLRSDLSGVLYEVGVELYRERRYREALHFFQSVREMDSRHLNSYLYEARSLAYLKEVDTARSMLRELLERYPSEARILRIMGRVEYLARDFDAAVALYQRALVMQPTFLPVLIDIAQARIRAGDWGGARASLDTLNARGYSSAFSLNLHSQVLEHEGRLEEARDVMQRAVRQEPSNPGFHHRLGRIAHQSGDFDSAISEFEHAITLDQNFPDPLLSLASLKADLEDVSASHALLERARGLPGVKMAVVLNIQAKLNLIRGDLDAARGVVSEALALERDTQNLSLAAEVEIRAIELSLDECRNVRPVVSQLLVALRDLGESQHADGLEARFDALCP